MGQDGCQRMSWGINGPDGGVFTEGDWGKALGHLYNKEHDKGNSIITKQDNRYDSNMHNLHIISYLYYLLPSSQPP